jgi:ubiquinone biosynthesis protein UbiJ
MIPASISSPASAAINYLLAAEPWAQRALLAHAGKVAVIDLGIASLRFRVDGDGKTEASGAETPADVTIHVKPADLPLILANRERAFSYVTIDGDAGFASTISQLAESLRWEAEEDLSRLIGDVAASRAVGGAKSLLRSVGTTRRNLVENVAEYLADERPMLVRPTKLKEFTSEVSRLRDDVERLAKRIDRLKKGTSQ